MSAAIKKICDRKRVDSLKSLRTVKITRRKIKQYQNALTIEGSKI